MMRFDSDTTNVELKSDGVHFMGDFMGNSGISRAGRDLIEVVQNMKIPTELLDLALSPERQKDSDRFIAAAPVLMPPNSRLTIAHCNPDSLAGVASRLPSQLFQGRRVIGVWYWETEVLPESHQKGFDWVDEVWVTSRFIAENLSKSSPVPVRHFPALMKLAEPPQTMMLPSFLRNDRFVFLFCFDYRSQALRKNPEGVCDAFIQAFPEMVPGGPMCVIKSFMAQEHFPLSYTELRLRYRHRPDILFIDRWFTTVERDSLLARADCYVSLHRSEGLGLTMLESMALGKPCIATAYSGNMDFMTEENSWLIPATMIPVGPGVWPFPPDDMWADPDLNEAALAMRSVFEDCAEAKKRGRLAQETVRARHNIGVVGKRVTELIEEALKGSARTKPATEAVKVNLETEPQLSPRARAFDLLKQARKDADAVKEQINAKQSERNATKIIGSLLGVIRSQQKAQSETLKELGELKRRLKDQEQSLQGLLTTDPQRLSRIVALLAENELSDRIDP